MALEYSGLWAVLDGEPTDEVILLRLQAVPIEALPKICAAVVDARANFVEERLGNTGASEDILEDLAGRLLREGQARFRAYQEDALPLPPREEWGAAERVSVVPLFSKVAAERLGQHLLDIFESQVET